MGMAARVMPNAERRMPRLSLARSPRKTSGIRSRKPRACGVPVARCKELFSAACLIMAVLTVMGIGRVMLTAKAAEASIDAGRLRADIKVERYAGDSLEADRSALATPSRIESIAGESLKMGQAPSVGYLELPPVSEVESESDVTQEDSPGPAVGNGIAAASSGAPLAQASTASSGRVAAIIASVMELAAGEAHVLLLGDVGLATSR